MADLKRTLTLTSEQRDDLIGQRDHHPQPYVRERAAAVLKIAEGREDQKPVRLITLQNASLNHSDYSELLKFVYNIVMHIAEITLGLRRCSSSDFSYSE